MSKHKYQEFYLLNDDRNHNVSILQHISDEKYLRKYDGNMYCPLCQGAQLSRVRGKSVFLRTNHGQEHGLMSDGELCEYAFNRKSIIETEAIIKDLKNTRQLSLKLNSILLQLKRREINKETIDPSLEEKRPNITKSKSSGVRKAKRTITPKYSFLNWGITTPQNHLIIAYGRVYIVIKKTDDGREYVWIFADDSKTELKTSFCKPDNKNIGEGYYYIIAVGKCKQKDRENKSYYNFELFDPYNGIVIEAVKKT